MPAFVSCQTTVQPSGPPFPEPTSACCPGDYNVNIPDPYLHAAVLTALGKAGGECICRVEMEEITAIYAHNKGISDLTGLEWGKNIEVLWVDSNNVTNLLPVMRLQSLADLNISTNGLTDLESFRQADLPSLVRLDMHNNQIASLSPLADAEMPKLAILYAGENELANLDGIQNFLGITELKCDRNKITDIGAVSNITGMLHFRACSNFIQDLAPLSGLHNAVVIDLGGNTTLANIAALSSCTAVSELYMDGCAVSDLSVVSGMTSIKKLSAAATNVTDAQPLVACYDSGGFHVSMGGYDIDLRGCTLNAASTATYMPYLAGNGVSVAY